MAMKSHEEYMRVAIKLAKRARGLTNPNPAVGALIVKDNRIIAGGYHKRCGLPHAEAVALERAGSIRTKGATLYVTLEPCDHFGRTPPCTDSIIRYGIKKVVIGMKDPNPINSGKGMRKLKRNGIETVVGVLEGEVRAINRPYLKFMTTGMPYVTVKIAESLDGKIATRTGDSRWVSSRSSRRYVHDLRGRVDAVMVGANTVIRDDPLLLSETSGSKQPVRIVVAGNLALPSRRKIFSSAARSPVIIATTKTSSKRRTEELYRRMGINILHTKPRRGKVDLIELLMILAKLNIMHIMVEGGGELVAGFIEEGLVDQFLFFIAPKIVGGRDAVTAVEGKGVKRMGDAFTLKNPRVRRFENDIMIEAEAGLPTEALAKAG